MFTAYNNDESEDELKSYVKKIPLKDKITLGPLDKY